MATYGSTDLGIILKGSFATIGVGATISNAADPADIPVAVFGPSGASRYLYNRGTIVATGSNGTGVYLQGGGEVKNGFGGVIEASSFGVVIGGGDGHVINYGIMAGIVLKAGGEVVNRDGIVNGLFDGIAISGGTGNVITSGTITGIAANSAGIYLSNGGGVGNAQGGLVAGDGQGIAIGTGAGNIANYGAVTATAADGVGVHLTQGGSVVNGSALFSGSRIVAANLGVAISGAAGTVVNYATINGSGAQGVGVYLTGGGYLNNRFSGLIEGGEQAVKITGGDATVVDYGRIIGGYGLVVDPGTAGQATVTVFGTIIGTTTIVSAGSTFQEAILFADGADLLVIDPSASIVGNINGGGLGTLDLAAREDFGDTTGTLAAFGTNVLGFGMVDVAADAIWQLNGNAGSVRFTNDGTIGVAGGQSLALGSVGEDAGSRGVIEIAGAATFDGAVAAGQRVVFAAPGASLVLNDAPGFAAKIVHFQPGDTIDVAGAVVTGTFAGHTLTLTNAKGKTLAALQLAGHYTTSQFTFTSDGHGGTVIGLAAPTASAYSAGGASGDGQQSWAAAPAGYWWTMRG